jgi:uncharacterized protein involved in exopolysaccharide biosynthesis
MIRLLLRRKVLIGTAMLAGVLIAWAVLQQMLPRYAAEALVVLDTRITHILKFDSVVANLAPEPDVIRTELNMLASDEVAE